ncbi:hypothetical protein HK101_008522 [Irineochytrium annulatum]|nr:hypothetical protein HK101_008522 [Irineochytrium annulatum]
MESATLPDPHYMEKQVEITWKLRKILVVWLIEVQAECELRPETLYLAINFLDRCCSRQAFTRSKYQLLGITALWVAAKYEENHGKVPTLKTLTYMCNNVFSEKEFIQMERLILDKLQFVLGHPTAETFIKHRCRPSFPHQTPISPEARAVARYLLELTLFHKRFVGARPSTLADACLAVACTATGTAAPSTVVGAHGHCACGCEPHADPHFAGLVLCLEEVCRSPPKQVEDKYTVDARFMGAPTLVLAWVEGGQRGSTAWREAEVEAAASVVDGQGMMVGGCMGERVGAIKLEDPCVGPSPVLNFPSGLMTPPKDVKANAGGPFRNFWPGQSSLAQQHRGGEYVAVSSGGAGGVVGRWWEQILGGYHYGHHAQQQPHHHNQHHHHQVLSHNHGAGGVPLGTGMEGVVVGGANVEGTMPYY